MDQEAVAILRDIKFNVHVLIGATMLVVAFSAFRLFRATRIDFAEALGKLFKLESEEQFEKGDLDRLVDTCSTKLRTHPNNVYALYYLGKAYFAKKDYESARYPFERLIEAHAEWGPTVRPYLDKIDAARPHEF